MSAYTQLAALLYKAVGGFKAAREETSTRRPPEFDLKKPSVPGEKIIDK
ncbi:MAG: hypothetical protein OXC19_12545 [Bryobacterales bacterium]|nr:hypothetical protein [Bryobacterales bacterium]